MKNLNFLWFLAIVAGCDDTEELTCEVLASPDFCWTVAVAEAYACNAGATVGELSTDGKTCEFESGITAKFTPALSRPFDIKELKIEVSDAAGQCATLTDDHSSMTTLKTKSGTVAVHARPTDYWVECPNGTTYTSDDVMELLNCGGGIADNARLPGVIISGGISASLTPRPVGPPHVFVDCASPAESP